MAILDFLIPLEVKSIREKVHIKTFRTTEKEHRAIMQKVAKSGLKFSEFVLRACLGKKIIVIDGLAEVRKELSRIGVNLNQLTVLANMGRIQVVHLGETREVLAATRQIVSDIDVQVRRS